LHSLHCSRPLVCRAFRITRCFLRKTSFWWDTQFDPIRLAFVRIAARVTVLVTRINVSLPSNYPYEHDPARFAGSAQAQSL
jgi:hypothetical protein